jgi:hypothetical protein
MSLADLSSIGSLLSSVAVLVSLIYLGLQTHQNAKHSRALIQQGRAARVADTALRIAELRDSDGIDKCFMGARDVSPKDLARFTNICRAIFMSAEDSFLQHEQGLLDATAFESFEASLRSGMGAPGVAAGWVLTRDMYEPKFRAYMNGMLGDLKPGGQSRALHNWNEALDSLSAQLPAGSR